MQIVVMGSRGTQGHDPTDLAVIRREVMREPKPLADNPALAGAREAGALEAVVEAVAEDDDTHFFSATPIELAARKRAQHQEKFILATTRDNHWITVGFILGALVTMSQACNEKKPEPQSPSQQQSQQRSFASPQDASEALFDAAKSGDKAAMHNIFGPGGDEIISSGDAVQDQNTREQFIAKYTEMHRVAAEPDGTTTLYIGAENWPVPIPIVQKNGAWYFDTDAGKQQILFRRIGRNELAAIDVCHALVAAEMEYHSQSRDGNGRQFARVLISDEGKHNGLYWKAGEGENESPIGPLVASAAGEGYRKSQKGEPSPYHGYYYRILTSQGGAAPGGAKNYLVNGNMTGGFAILAYPSNYRSAGVMTFIVGQKGVVYEKDLGSDTKEVAANIQAYSPDDTWVEAE